MIIYIDHEYNRWEVIEVKGEKKLECLDMPGQQSIENIKYMLLKVIFKN